MQSDEPFIAGITVIFISDWNKSPAVMAAPFVLAFATAIVIVVVALAAGSISYTKQRLVGGHA